MGTHPIFESDFDCLTGMNRLLILTRSVSIKTRQDSCRTVRPKNVDKEMLPKAKGTIEFFHRAKAFGVIAGDDGESYYFYPHSFAERYKPKRGLWKPVMKKVVPGTPVEFYWNEGTNSKTYECIRKVWSC